MMDIPLVPAELNQVKDIPTRSSLISMWQRLTKSINGRLDFGTPQGQSVKQTGNLDGTWPGTLTAGYTITTPAGVNTEFTVTHNLGRIPTGYDVKSKDRAGSIYDSRKSSWTTTQMFLKADTASMNIVLFVH